MGTKTQLKRSNLYKYQERAVDFIKTHENCALFMDMGLGKTSTTLTAFQDLRNSLDASRLLVVAPLRIARSVWDEEIASWDHLTGLTTAHILGTEKQRLAALDQEADIHLINRENVQWLEEQIVQDKRQVREWPWDMVVLDESQSFKSQSSKRFKSLRKLRKLYARCVELTGTPIPNGYADLWSQIYLLDRGERLGLTETAFKERWFSPPPFGQFGWGWMIKPWAPAQIEEAISDIVLTMRAEDYLELPPVKNNFIRVNLPETAKSKYRRLERHFVLETIGGNTVTAVNAGVLCGRLAQLANGTIYVGKDKYEEFHDEKVKALAEVLEGVPKALIAYDFRADLVRVEETLQEICKGTKRTWEFLDTEDSKNRWNSGQTNFLVLHPGSAGHGLNLQFAGANDIVWYGLTDNLEHYQQLNARLTGGHRRGDKTISIHHIVANDTIDDDLMELIQRKTFTQDGLKAALAKRLH